MIDDVTLMWNNGSDESICSTKNFIAWHASTAATLNCVLKAWLQHEMNSIHGEQKHCSVIVEICSSRLVCSHLFALVTFRRPCISRLCAHKNSDDRWKHCRRSAAHSVRRQTVPARRLQQVSHYANNCNNSCNRPKTPSAAKRWT